MPKNRGTERDDFTHTWPASEGEAGQEAMFAPRGRKERRAPAGSGLVLAVMLVLVCWAISAAFGVWR